MCTADSIVPAPARLSFVSLSLSGLRPRLIGRDLLRPGSRRADIGLRLCQLALCLAHLAVRSRRRRPSRIHRCRARFGSRHGLIVLLFRNFLFID